MRFTLDSPVPRPPARASHKMRRPASRENGPHDFFLFWRTLAEQLSPDRARSWDGAPRAIFSLRERAAAATLTYYSNNGRENEVNAP